jgi:M6 family metalloprotease-like protein
LTRRDLRLHNPHTPGAVAHRPPHVVAAKENVMGRVLRTLCVLIALAGLLAASAAAATYPSPPFDFAHPGTPHEPRMTPAGGDNDRPMLVVYGRFSANGPDTPGVTATTISQMFFGGYPSVFRYFRDDSFGRLTFPPVQETEGSANDGVITIDLGDRATFDGQSEAVRGRRVVDLADPYINYAAYDRNNDGRVDENELVIFHVFTAVPTATDLQRCGATRNIGSGGNLDGKNLTGREYSSGTTLTNVMTHIHEVSHQALGHQDHGYAGGALDVTGPTCAGPGNLGFDPLFSYNSWHKLHFGWTTPTVVSRDGYYTVGRWDTTGQSYLLYDPDRGTQDYLLVENRQPTPNTNERDAADSGLVLWRIDDRRFNMARPYVYEHLLPAGGVAPDSYGGSTADAFDPSDPSTPQTSVSPMWSDGSASKLAVRAIGPSGAQVRAYFDVRGPGVLVLTPAAVQTVTMAQANPVTFPVRNTGEESAALTFTLAGLPSGWSAAAQTQTLAADTDGTATVQLTVPGDVPTGVYAITAVGTSADGSIRTETPLSVRVQKRATNLSLATAGAGDYSDPTVLTATLTDSATSAGVPGKTVSFTLGTQSASATTDAAGVATATIVVDQPSGSVPAGAGFAGDGTYLAASDSGSFRIDKEMLAFAYRGDTLLDAAATPVLAALATQEADGSAGDLTRATAVFTLAPTLTAVPYTYPAAVAADGSTSATATGLPVDVWSVTVAVPADNAYWEGGSGAPVELVRFDPAGRFTGDAAGRDAAGAPVSVRLNAQYDRGRPKGSADLTSSAGVFTGRLAWIVQVGDRAVLQVAGTLGTAQATLRLYVEDNAEPGRPDVFRAAVGSYDSGRVTATSGNLQSHL